MSNVDQRPIILTGDRPTGQLHLGHFVGSLRSRVGLQDSHHQHLLLADAQALTDNADNPEKVRNNILQVALDYLAVGIDPTKTTICVQSCLPALNELTMLYLNFVTVARLERNPTIKSEIQMRGFERDIPAGFLCYPVAQAADITAFKATVIPVGEDQIPMIEKTNEIVRRLNRQIGHDLLPECKALLSNVSRLPGFDGKAKMSKSLGNHIPLSVFGNDKALRKLLGRAVTDEKRVNREDVGNPDDCNVYSMHKTVSSEADLAWVREGCTTAGIGCVDCKGRLADNLNNLFAGYVERRAELVAHPERVKEILYAGAAKARAVAQKTMDEVRAKLGLWR